MSEPKIFIYSLIQENGKQDDHCLNRHANELDILQVDYEQNVIEIEEKYDGVRYTSIVVFNTKENASQVVLDRFTRQIREGLSKCLYIIHNDDSVYGAYEDEKTFKLGKLVRLKSKPKNKDYFMIKNEYFAIR
jgi:hypothetical protein